MRPAALVQMMPDEERELPRPPAQPMLTVPMSRPIARGEAHDVPFFAKSTIESRSKRFYHSNG